MRYSIKYQNHLVNYYAEGNGEIVILLHGWPTNSRLWNAQVEVLKERYKVITLDWLGFGKSDKPEHHQYTFVAMREILDTIIKELSKNNEPLNIVAHDIGGPPAILWASENQKRVKRLILLNTVIYNFSTPLDKLSHFFFEVPIIKEFIVSPFGLKTLMKTLSKNRKAVLKDSIKDILAWHEKLKSNVKLKTILEPLKDAKQKAFLSLDEKFKQLQVDKYLVIAKGDPLCYAHIKKLKENNPNIPSFFIDRCGHYIPVDRPGELNEILSQILGNELYSKPEILSPRSK